ncbi:MAG TPA: GNAT family N-acetyltransferase [Lichenihabitans sp.]|jgi:GNAT superfamily N-acetyltransferase|nr:GNAT family N-acetyltransferase [Lichenihabitans sp.]
MTGTESNREARTEVEWCRDPAKAQEVARLFVAHADVAYISHSELMFGRASARDRWSDDLRDRISGEAARAIADAPAHGASSRTRLASATIDGRFVGFAFVSFPASAGTPFGVVEDLLIAPEHRGRGVGRAVLAWIADECRALGCRRLFLESGVANHDAHGFFARQGFGQTSIVMMREL